MLSHRVKRILFILVLFVSHNTYAKCTEAQIIFTKYYYPQYILAYGNYTMPKEFLCPIYVLSTDDVISQYGKRISWGAANRDNDDYFNPQYLSDSEVEKHQEEVAEPEPKVTQDFESTEINRLANFNARIDDEKEILRIEEDKYESVKFTFHLITSDYKYHFYFVLSLLIFGSGVLLLKREPRLKTVITPEIEAEYKKCPDCGNLVKTTEKQCFSCGSYV